MRGYKGSQPPDPERRNKWLKFLTELLGILSIGATAVLIILKLDGLTAVGDWHWGAIFLPAVAVAGGFLLLWMILDYISLAPDAQLSASASRSSGGGGGYQLVGSSQVEVDREILRRVHPSAVENYHEAYVFRDLLLGTGYLVLMTYAILTGVTACNCATPYGVMAIILACLYGLRLTSLVWQGYREYDHLRRMAVELRYDYLRVYDEPNGAILKDLWLSSPWEFGYALTVFMFGATVIVAGMSAIWVAEGECSTSCGYQYEQMEALLWGVEGLEAVAFVTAVLMRYAKRKSGVESVDVLTNRVVPQMFPLVRRAEQLVPRVSPWWLWTRNESKLKELFKPPQRPYGVE